VYECRCPHDEKKLAELGRPPLSMQHYDFPCKCGRWVRGRIIQEKKTERILSVASCSCGRTSRKAIGYLVIIQCGKCKATVKF